MIDTEQLLLFLLKRDAPEGVDVQQSVDMDSIDSLPLVTFEYHGFGQNQNGDGLWHVVLTLNLFHDDPTGIFDIVSTLNDAIHAWSDANTGILPGVGHVQLVTDLELFAPLPASEIPSRKAEQYVGSWTLALRNT